MSATLAQVTMAQLHQAALCPHCQMDAVLPSYNGNQADAATLAELKRYTD